MCKKPGETFDWSVILYALTFQHIHMLPCVSSILGYKVSPVQTQDSLGTGHMTPRRLGPLTERWGWIRISTQVASPRNTAWQESTLPGSRLPASPLHSLFLPTGLSHGDAAHL